MTVREVSEELFAAASAVYDEREARAAAAFLMERRFGISRLQVAAEPFSEISTEELEGVIKDVERGRPVQYIAGEAWFCDMWLEVGEGVLVPRPETEELVRWVQKYGLDDADGGILDVGTGSGAIAIALARSGFSGVAGVDISPEALEIAEKNAERYNANVEFINDNILESFKYINISTNGVINYFNKLFNTIISNPPYIPASQRAWMGKNVVDFEPENALFVPDDDPLIFYRTMAHTGVKRLFFEIHEDFGNEICELMEKSGYRTELRKDINGRPRMVCSIKEN